VLLKIYIQLPNGKRVLSLVKEFKVVKLPEPRINIDGVESDSAVHQMRVVAMGYLHAPNIINRNTQSPKDLNITSFELHLINKGKTDTLKATGNRLTFEMRNRIDKMPDGSVLQFNNIRYMVGTDTFIAQPTRVYLLRDDINKY
jgi:hypothetical protein